MTPTSAARMHEIFDLSNKRGLSNLLRDELNEESLLSTIQQTAIPGLAVLTAGSATNSVSHLLYSPCLGALLRSAKTRYDLVLVDTPPMLHMPDARVVGALSDAVVLIVRASQTDRTTLISAQERFMEDRTNVLGTILNGWDPTKNQSGHSYYREYQHYRTAASGR